jgi:hypothetical protein
VGRGSAELLGFARQSADPAPENLRWLETDLAALASLPQPLAGRRIPGLLAAQGLRDIVASPFSFSVSEPVWRRIVRDTLTAGPSPDPAVSAWLGEQAAAAACGEFVAAFTGVLTTASRP